MLNTKSNLGHGGTGINGKGPGTVEFMVRQMQSLTFKVVTGAAAATPFTLTGVKEGTHIMGAFYANGGVLTAVPDLAYSSDDNVVSATVSTATQQVVVWYYALTEADG
jgi:hypothetical protein